VGARRFAPETLQMASDGIRNLIEQALDAPQKDHAKLRALFVAQDEVEAALERKPPTTAPRVGRPKGARNKPKTVASGNGDSAEA
jgi:hypothetical protein